MLARRIHFYTGVITLIHFAVTGALMRFNFFEIEKEDILIRSFLRSNHIYILFAALLNLSVHFIFKNVKYDLFTRIGSSLLIFGTIMLCIAFYTDPVTHSIQRDITRLGLYGCFAGMVVLLLYLQFYKKSER